MLVSVDHWTKPGTEIFQLYGNGAGLTESLALEFPMPQMERLLWGRGRKVPETLYDILSAGWMF